MAATSGKQYGVGARKAVIFALNASGTPAATDTSPYTGVQMVGVKTVDITIPDPQKKTHLGDDRALQIDYLPATEGISGTLTLAQDDHVAYALLTSTNRITVGESTAVGINTSEQGNEPQVGLLTFQQSLDANGVRNWRWFLMPKVILYPKPSGMSENVAVHTYTISPAVVTAHLWGTTFTSTAEGFTEAQGLIGMSRYMPSVCAWLATTSATTFAFPSGVPAAATTNISVFVDGVADTAWTPTTTNITTSTAPGNTKRVVVFYEHN